jgi:hypothetical protein
MTTQRQLGRVSYFKNGAGWLETESGERIGLFRGELDRAAIRSIGIGDEIEFSLAHDRRDGSPLATALTLYQRAPWRPGLRSPGRGPARPARATPPRRAPEREALAAKLSTRFKVKVRAR